MFRPLVVMFLAAFLWFPCSIASHKKVSASDEKAYFNHAGVRGTVTILNHPTLGKTPDAGVQIVFQRVGCRCCAISIRTEINGRYELYVIPGRYNLLHGFVGYEAFQGDDPIL